MFPLRHSHVNHSSLFFSESVIWEKDFALRELLTGKQSYFYIFSSHCISILRENTIYVYSDKHRWMHFPMHRFMNCDHWIANKLQVVGSIHSTGSRFRETICKHKIKVYSHLSAGTIHPYLSWTRMEIIYPLGYHIITVGHYCHERVEQ